MTALDGMEWFQRMLWTSILAGGPIVASTVVIGLIMAILQAATQVQDQSVAFGPKAAALIATLIATGPWMLRELTAFAHAVLVAVARL